MEAGAVESWCNMSFFQPQPRRGFTYRHRRSIIHGPCPVCGYGKPLGDDVGLRCPRCHFRASESGWRCVGEQVRWLERRLAETESRLFQAVSVELARRHAAGPGGDVAVVRSLPRPGDEVCPFCYRTPA